MQQQVVDVEANKSDSESAAPNTDFCCTSSGADEDDDDQAAPLYQLRPKPATDVDYDWIRAPQFFDEEQISQLTNEQIKTTLDYFSK